MSWDSESLMLSCTRVSCVSVSRVSVSCVWECVSEHASDGASEEVSG